MEFSLTDENISTVTRGVCSTMLGLELQVVSSSDNLNADTETISGVVHILGDWQGSVSVICCKEMAALCASKMFCMDALSLEQEQIFDCIKELTNMVGGNLKSNMGPRCVLSIPKANGQKGYEFKVPETEIINAVEFRYAELPVLVRVHQGHLEIPSPSHE
ncbi:MAG: chemotaxis protein CheX [Bdellovibrionales bacterium]|nr:chemotaxis protein CheX [Bdellovibrionales bacterium]